MSAERCSEWWTKDWSRVQCSRAGKVQRGGKWFCTQHDPERVAARHAKRHAEWDARNEAERAARAKEDREREAGREAVLFLRSVVAWELLSGEHAKRAAAILAKHDGSAP